MVSMLPLYCANYENVMFTASLETGVYQKTGLHKEFWAPTPRFQPGQFMVAVNNRSSCSSYSHSISTWNNSDYVVANLHFLLNTLHGKYNPASIKILKNPATFKITFPNKKRKMQLFVHGKINFQPIFILPP